MVRPVTLDRDVSPPPLNRISTQQKSPASQKQSSDSLSKSEPAAIEAGEVEVRDHLSYFVNHLSSVARSTDGPCIPLAEFKTLYEANSHAHGAHFVIHQHDHPISGVHYDLRVQFSESSTVSFAVPYGLPGNPNSQRPNRMAIETRVHNLWNNLIESASHASGSLLIWDTGTYEVLPRYQQRTKDVTDDENSDSETYASEHETSQNEKLVRAFQSRHIHLRLSGSRLPKNYTIAMRLPSANNRAAQPKQPKRKRRRLNSAAPIALVNTDSDSDAHATPDCRDHDESLEAPGTVTALASEDDEDATIRANNAYTGASNTIGSIHQRHWFLTLDRLHSGFQKMGSGPDAGRWIGSWESFFVRGRDHERSVVTGRTADDVMADEGVEKFIARKMWRPVIE